MQTQSRIPSSKLDGCTNNICEEKIVNAVLPGKQDEPECHIFQDLQDSDEDVKQVKQWVRESAKPSFDRSS